MRRNFGRSQHGPRDMMMDSGTGDRQTAFVRLLQKQSQVIEKLTDRVMPPTGPGYMDAYDDPYGDPYGDSYDDSYGEEYYEEEYYPAPGPDRMRSRGMMSPPMGMRGRSGAPRARGAGLGSAGGPMGGGSRGMMGPRGPRGPRGVMGPRGGMGPKGSRHFGKEAEPNDPKFLKQCKVYLESIKKNIPTNKDNLSVYCAACSHLAKNNQEFFNHRSSVHHTRQMEKIQMMPMSIQKEVKKVIDQVHIQRSAQKSLMFCEICDEKLPIPYSDHKNIIAHQLRSKAVRAGCIPCKTGPMKSYPVYKEHCETEDHEEKSKTFKKELDEKIAGCTQLKDFPPFQEGVLYGTDHVKKSNGYYCGLCRKFTPSEEDMLVHAKLPRHFNHVRDEYFNKKRTEPLDMGDYTLPGEGENKADGETDNNTNGNSEIKTEEAMETTEN